MERRAALRPIIAAGALAAVLAGCAPHPAGAVRPVAVAGNSATASRAPTRTAGSDAVIATASRARVTVRTGPGGSVERTLADPTAIGAPLTFLVLDRRPGWLRVALPGRPNGSTGWVSASAVRLSSTPFRLVVSMSGHRLDLLRGGVRIARYPVGLGVAATPTPDGLYYLTELIRPPDPHGAYGPYAFGLSAYSDVLTSFAGGPGQIGLHGTDAPTGLGGDVSHGCIRVANRVITRLARLLPLGTPVEIRR